VREMSISENYEGEITPISSNISRFSRGTDGFGFTTFYNLLRCLDTLPLAGRYSPVPVR
jgi:hypothetical protein